MELIFQETQVQYLKPIVNETVHLEQTADLVVSDALADIDRVVDASGTAMIRSAECSATAVGIEGVVQAGVLFVGDDGHLHALSAQIPFSVRKEVAQEGKLQCTCALTSVDARAVNSRKLLVRVGLACQIRVLAQSELTCYDIEEPAPNLQLKRQTLPLNMPVAVGEKGFSVHEELELSAEQPEIERVLKFTCRTQLAEQKIVGDKAVFKGGVQLQVLYEDEDGKLNRGQWNVPFSQYATLGRELDEAQLQTDIRMIAAELEPDVRTHSRRLLLSVELLAQCTANAQQQVALIEDAFCTDAELTAELTECSAEGILDLQVLRQNLTASNDTAAKSVVDACMYLEAVHMHRVPDGMELDLSVNCNVLYYDTEGQLQGKTFRTGAQQMLAMAQNACCRLVQADWGEIFCSSGASGMELRMPLALTVECTAEHVMQVLCRAQIVPREKEEGRRPSVILRRTDNDEELWQLAKTYRTSVQTVIEANELLTQQLTAGTMLLIPMT